MKYLILVALLMVGCAKDQGTTYSTKPIPSPNCTVSTVYSPISGSLIQCPDGSSSFVSNGINPSPITIVQFCPGTTTYPSEFNEVGFCINNQLYANYSLNNGFWSLIPPGYYNSNALNSNCNFTVTTNCGIINQ
jgi:hypothetical protein